MGRRVLCVGGRTGERLESARRFIEAHHAGRERWWVVSKSRRAADAFVRGMATDEPRLGLERASVTQWLSRSSPPWAPPFAEGLAADALTARAAMECASELRYFGPIAALPGFARALRATLRDLALFGSMDESLDRAGLPGRDLERLRSAVRSVHERHQLRMAHESLADVQPAHDVRGVVLLDVAVESPAHAEAMKRLLAECPFVFASSRGGVERDALVHVLDPDAVEEPIPPARPGSVTLRACRTEAQEGVEAVRFLLDRSRAGVPFDRMAVVVRTPVLHAAPVEEALRRADVPYVSSREARRPHPAGRALLALLRCAEDGLSARRFAEYLSFGQVPAAALEAEAHPSWLPAVDPDGQLAFGFSVPPSTPDDDALDGGLQVPLRWEQWLRDAAVVGSRDRWKRRLDGFLRELALQLRDRADETDRSRLESKRASVERLQRFAIPVIERLDGLAEPRTWGQWLDGLEDLATHALSDAVLVRQILAQLRPLDGVGPVSLFEVIQALEPRLSELRVEPSRDPYGKVLVAAPGDVRGRVFDTVVVVGLAEGAFPESYREDPLLPDDARQVLGLPGRDRQDHDERSLFDTAVESAERSVLLTYARRSGSRGRAQVPSAFFIEAVEVAQGLEALGEFTATARDRRPFGLEWELPVEPGDAIDPGEYDLTIAAQVHDGRAPSGVAAYLTAGLPSVQGRSGGAAGDASQSLILYRGLRRRSERWRSRWSPHDGYVAPSDEVHTPAPLPVLSPTGLQAFAACPYRFWLHSVLRLRAEEDLLGPERLEPLTRGSILHDVQFRFVRRCLELGRSPSTSPDLLEEAWRSARDRYREELAPAIPAVFDRDLEELRLDLRAWWRLVGESTDGYEPRHPELAFGLGPAGDEHDRASTPEPVELDGGHRVRGSIDLVEVDGRGRLRVTDYKTGRPPRGALVTIGHGEVLQPVIYGLAAERLLAATADDGRLAYCTLKHGLQVREIAIGERARRDLTFLFETVDRHAREGFFVAAPRSGACAWCDYRPVCGHREEQRIERKSGEGLSELRRLREIR